MTTEDTVYGPFTDCSTPAEFMISARMQPDAKDGVWTLTCRAHLHELLPETGSMPDVIAVSRLDAIPDVSAKPCWRTADHQIARAKLAASRAMSLAELLRLPD